VLLDLHQFSLQSLQEMHRDAYESLSCHHREEQLLHQVEVLAYCRILRAAPYEISAYASKIYLHSFQMHLQCRRDLDRD
jgi:hypothetical protein